MAELTVLRNEILTEFKKNLSDEEKNRFSATYQQKVEEERRRVISEMKKLLEINNSDNWDDLFKYISAN